MGSEDNLYSVDQDYNATSKDYQSTSGRIGTTAASAQAGRVVCGYDPTSLLQPFRVDANGNLRVNNAGPSGVYVYNGQPAITPTANQYGSQILALQPLPAPASYSPITLDPSGALNVHDKSKATARFIVPTIAGGAAGKSMFSIINGSTATILRIQQVNLQTPYIYTTGGTVIGLSMQANQSVVMLHEMRRITGRTGGTAVSYGLADTNDAAMMDAAILAYTGATVSGAAAAPFHRADANSPSGLPWYLRGDPNQKTLNLRPGEGMSINTISNTTNYNFDIEVVTTVALG